MKKYRFYTVLMAVIWVFIRGSPEPQTFVSGLIVSYPIAFYFRRFYPGSINLSSLANTRYLLIYAMNFTKELLISNLDVAYRVIHPGMPTEPDVLEYSLELEHPTAITLLANSITLTPGTLVIDHSEEENCLVIHCLQMEDEQKVSEGIRYWEKLLMKAFGETE